MEQKPRGPSDVYCPQWKRRCDKVCHNCAWWDRVEMEANHPQTGVRTEVWYRCAVNWNTTVALDTGRRMERLGSEMERLNKTFGGVMNALVSAAQAARIARQPKIQELVVEDTQKSIEDGSSEKK